MNYGDLLGFLDFDNDGLMVDFIFSAWRWSSVWIVVVNGDLLAFGGLILGPREHS